MNLIYFGSWYYDHSSTMLPVLTDEEGRRSDWGKVSIALDYGHTVNIRPATFSEHSLMARRFDEIVDEQAKQGWVYGLGNFDRETPPANLQEHVNDLKRQAREQ